METSYVRVRNKSSLFFSFFGAAMRIASSSSTSSMSGIDSSSSSSSLSSSLSLSSTFTRLISGISSTTPSFSSPFVFLPPSPSSSSKSSSASCDVGASLFPASTHPSSSPLNATSFPQFSSIAFARFLHGTFLVAKYCFSSGKYFFLVSRELLFFHCQVGHVSTR